MPLASKRNSILANNRQSTLLTLRRLAFRTLRLALQTPRIAILLNMRHALLKRIAALRAEEMPIVPILPQRHEVLAHDGRLAVLALRRVGFVEIEMAEKALSCIAVLSHGLALFLRNVFSLVATLDAIEALFAFRRRLGVDLERL